jgi:PAS domain S-box-containing protein
VGGGSTDRDVAQLDLATLEALVELIPDAAVAADVAGRIRAVNQLAAELFDHPAADLVGATVELLVPEALRDRHRDQHRRYLVAPRARRMGAGIDLSGRRRDGSEFPVDIALAPVATDEGPMVLATIRDLTERRREQAAQAHLAAIVESTNDAVAATDLDGVVTSWNPGAERLLGYRAEEMLGQPIYEVVAPEFRDGLARARRQIIEGETVAPFESRRLRKDGTLVDVEITLSAIHDRSGRLLGVSGVFRDITERRRAEAERARAQREREELGMLAERERIARDLHDLVIQRVFGAGMSLSAVAGLVEDAIASRLNQVVDELDAVISDIRATVFDLERHGTAANLRAEVLELTSEAAHALGHDPVVRFSGLVDQAVPEEVAEQVRAVVNEALANVARHAHATATTVEVSVDEDELVVLVVDNGVGLGTPSRSSGLRNLRERAAALGGSLEVGPGERGGTALAWRVPLPSAAGSGTGSGSAVPAAMADD